MLTPTDLMARLERAEAAVGRRPAKVAVTRKRRPAVTLAPGDALVQAAAEAKPALISIGLPVWPAPDDRDPQAWAVCNYGFGLSELAGRTIAALDGWAAGDGVHKHEGHAHYLRRMVLGKAVKVPR